jgi:hypothetical protein
MEHASPFLAMQRVEGQVKTLLRGVDADLLASDEKKTLAGLRRLMTDVRLDIRDYELSETRDEQIKCRQAAKKRLGELQKAILAVSAAFSPADVAQVSARLEQIEGWLQ